jgi:signal peptidase I
MDFHSQILAKKLAGSYRFSGCRAMANPRGRGRITGLYTLPKGTPVTLQPERNRPRVSSRHALRRELLEIALLVVTIYTFVNLSTVRAIVEGPSMQPNFYTGQLIIVSRFIYYFASPARGDVIVLHDPEDPSEDFIKRVIGLPGELVQLKQGRVYINGALLDEPYITEFCDTCPDDSWKLDDQHYFILGDNRNHSLDSHRFGPIDRRLIVGQAWIRYWPLSDFAIIPHPAYRPISTVIPALPPTPTMPIPRSPGDSQDIPGNRSRDVPQDSLIVVDERTER